MASGAEAESPFLANNDVPLIFPSLCSLTPMTPWVMSEL